MTHPRYRCRARNESPEEARECESTARAEHAQVVIGTAGGRLAIEVSDDGIGFDPDAATSGFGVAGMRERVVLGGGELDITPGPSGTTVRTVLPLSELDEAVVEGVPNQIGA